MSRLLTSPSLLEPKEFTPANINYFVPRHDDVRQSSDEGEPKVLHENFRNQFPKTERDIVRLLTPSEGWDEYDTPWPNPASVTHARSWAERLYRDVSTELWLKPRVSADEDGDVVFEWWKGRKKLSAYISPTTAEYITVKKEGPSVKMEDGSIDTPEDCRMLWRWLIS